VRGVTVKELSTYIGVLLLIGVIVLVVDGEPAVLIAAGIIAAILFVVNSE
jgi:hypothetical protein